MSLSNSDIKEIEKITRKEIKDFLETTQAHSIVTKIIQKEIKKCIGLEACVSSKEKCTLNLPLIVVSGSLEEIFM